MSSKVALVRFTLSFGYFAVKAAFTAVTHWACIDALSVQVSSIVMVASGRDPGSVLTFDGAVDSAGAVPPGAQPAIGMVTAAAARPRKVRRVVIMVSPRRGRGAVRVVVGWWCAGGSRAGGTRAGRAH